MQAMVVGVANALTTPYPSVCYFYRRLLRCIAHDIAFVFAFSIHTSSAVLLPLSDSWIIGNSKWVRIY